MIGRTGLWLKALKRAIQYTCRCLREVLKRAVSRPVGCSHIAPLMEKDAYTLNRAEKRTQQPEQVVCMAGGLGALACGAGCDVCSGDARAVTVQSSGSTMV